MLTPIIISKFHNPDNDALLAFIDITILYNPNPRSLISKNYIMADLQQSQPILQETSAQPLDLLSFLSTIAAYVLPVIILYKLFKRFTRRTTTSKND